MTEATTAAPATPTLPQSPNDLLALQITDALITAGLCAEAIQGNPKEDDIAITPSVRVIFSGGKGTEKHRADKAIIGEAQHHAKNGNGTGLYFVTEDQDLARKVTAAHKPAIAIASRDLMRVLTS